MSSCKCTLWSSVFGIRSSINASCMQTWTLNSSEIRLQLITIFIIYSFAIFITIPRMIPSDFFFCPTISAVINDEKSSKFLHVRSWNQQMFVIMDWNMIHQLLQWLANKFPQFEQSINWLIIEPLLPVIHDTVKHDWEPLYKALFSDEWCNFTQTKGCNKWLQQVRFINDFILLCLLLSPCLVCLYVIPSGSIGFTVFVSVLVLI